MKTNPAKKLFTRALAFAALAPLCLSSADAADTPSTKKIVTSQSVAADFTSRWMSSPMSVAKNKRGEVRGKFMERMVWLKGRPAFSIGSITYFSTPKDPNAALSSYSPEFIAGRVAQALQIPQWNKRKQGRALVFEAPWTSARRYVRFYFTQDAQRFSMSVGVFRSSYLDSVLLESELIQRNLAGVLEKSPTWLNWMMAAQELQDWLVPSANAQDACGAGVTGPAAALCGAKNPTDIVSELSKLNQNLANSNTQGVQLQGSIDKLGGQIQDGMASLERTEANIRKATDMAPMINETNRQLDRANTTAEDGLKYTKKTFSRKNLAITGLITGVTTGVGLSLGGLAMGAIASGIKGLAEYLREAITHEKRDEELLAEFNTALANYSKLAPIRAETEDYVDGMVDLITELRQAGDKERLLDQYALLIGRAEDEKAENELRRQRARINGASAACREAIILEGESIRRAIKQASAIRDKIEETPDPSKAYCASAKEQVRQVLWAEEQMFQASAALNDQLAIRLHKDQIEKAHVLAMEHAQRANDPKEMTDTRAFDEQAADKNLENEIAARPRLAQGIESAEKQCEKERMTVSRIRVIARQRIEKQCDQLARDPASKYASPYARELQAIAKASDDRWLRAEANFDYAKNTPIQSNPRSFEAALSANDELLKNIRRETTALSQDDRTARWLKKKSDLFMLCDVGTAPRGAAANPY